jgi:hypothetical protein
MISKKTFVETINNIQAQEKKAADFTKALNIYCDGNQIFDTNNLYLKSLLTIFKEMFHDEHETISWWLWEDVEKKVWINYGQKNEIVIDVSTPELLYDYLVVSMNENYTLTNNAQNRNEDD